MKKIFFALTAFVMMFAACQKEDNSPTVSFESALPVTSDGVATLTLSVTNYTGTEPVTVPVTFTSDAVEGEDYEVSATEFVYGGAEPVTTITITPLKFGTGKSITASLEIPAGFKAGQYPSSTFSLSEKLGYLSFDSKASLLTQTLTVQVTIYDKDGNRKVLEKGDKIAVSIDTENSTAVENTHFIFDGEKAVTVDAGQSTGNVKIKLVGDEAVQDHDKIVLKLDLGEKYSAGQNATNTITIIGSSFSKMEGKWVINKIVTDKEYMKGLYGASDDDFIGFPVFNDQDALTIDFNGGMLIPDFKSEFKNFFIGTSNMQMLDEVTIPVTTDFPPKRDTFQQFKIDNVNRYFSAEETSEDNEAIIGIKIFNDDETNQELLSLYVIDYNSKTFCSSADWSWMFEKDKPTATSVGAFINVTFKKAE